MRNSVRRLFSLAPLPVREVLVLLAAGAALFVGVAAPPADSLPRWASLAAVAIGALCVLRGVLGFAGSIGAQVQRLRKPEGWPGDRAPRTAEEAAEVLAKKPGGWEYLYFIGCLISDRATLEGTFLDHELRYAAPAGETVADDQVVPFLHGAMNDALRHMENLKGMMEPEVQDRALGPRGVAGDPDRIRHLAERWTSVYGELMSWAARLRSARVSSEYRGLFDSLANVIDRPVHQYREFIDDFARDCDAIPKAVAKHQPLTIERTLTMSMDEQALETFGQELAKVPK
jgi:hypothetical protein